MTAAPSHWVTSSVDGDMGLAEAALAYAASGLAVLPLHHPSGRPGRVCSCPDAGCRNVGKHPRTEHGLHDASTDVSCVAHWWQRWPRSNIGLVTGDRFDVLDIDGEEGVAALRQLPEDLPLSGPVAQTGGGWHYCEGEDARGCVLGLV